MHIGRGSRALADRADTAMTPLESLHSALLKSRVAIANSQSRSTEPSGPTAGRNVHWCEG